MSDDESDHARGVRLVQAREAALGPESSAADGHRHTGTPYSLYVNHEKGERGFKEWATLYARKYNVELNWLWSGRGPMRRGGKEPIQEKYEALTPENRPELLRYADYLISTQKPPEQ